MKKIGIAGASGKESGIAQKRDQGRLSVVMVDMEPEVAEKASMRFGPPSGSGGSEDTAQKPRPD